VEFVVDVRSRKNGELWASYRLQGIDSAEQQLCADVHGLQYECHAPRFDAPVQSQFYPMPTMAWQEDAHTRFTWVAGQPTGVANLKTGLTIMLDRCGDHDDARGLGQGITDARPATLRFEVLVETLKKSRKPSVFGPPYEGNPSPRALAARTRTLNPLLELAGTLPPTVESSKAHLLQARLPAWELHDTHWTNRHVAHETVDDRWE
jgi:alpha-mannosidase II